MHIDNIISDSIAAVILAGGNSHRMKADKSLLPVLGCTLIEFIVTQIRPYFKDIIISCGNKDKYSFLNLPMIEDEAPGQGPLFAILSVLKKSPQSANFIMACDIPQINIPFLQKLVSAATDFDIAVPCYLDGKFEPLFAVYHRRIIPQIETLISAGERKISALFACCRTNYIPLDAQTWFCNLNTWNDYQNFLLDQIDRVP
jgi:molybdopterin-guanine dinucleotide biosynthesis protein A